jgi:hypothetical protein
MIKKLYMLIRDMHAKSCNEYVGIGVNLLTPEFYI